MKIAFALVFATACSNTGSDRAQVAATVKKSFAETYHLEVAVSCTGEPLMKDGDKMACEASDRYGHISPVEVTAIGNDLRWETSAGVDLDATVKKMNADGIEVLCERTGSILIGEGEWYECPIRYADGGTGRIQLSKDKTLTIKDKDDVERLLAANHISGATVTCAIREGYRMGNVVTCEIASFGHRIPVTIDVDQVAFPKDTVVLDARQSIAGQDVEIECLRIAKLGEHVTCAFTGSDGVKRQAETVAVVGEQNWTVTR